MRITFSSGVFPPDIGGSADFVPRIATWLVERGHTVDVVCWSDGAAVDDGDYVFRVHRIIRQGTRLWRYRKTTAALLRAGRLTDIFLANTLDHEVHTAAKLLDKPVVHKVVGDAAWEIARSRRWYTGTIDDYQRAPKSGRLWALDRWRNYPMMRAGRIVVPSRYLASIVAGWGVPTDRVQVILNSTPVVASRGGLRLPNFPGKTLVTVCRLVPWKGVNGLISVLPDLPATRLVVAGDGPEGARFEALAREKGVSERVVFLGRIDKDDVRSLLEAADVFVLNSSYEGLPHVVLEAMAAGAPVVATDAGGMGEVVTNQETGLLIPHSDNAALLAALRQMLRPEGPARTFAANARQMVARVFGEEACFRQYEAALQEVATCRRIGTR